MITTLQENIPPDKSDANRKRNPSSGTYPEIIILSTDTCVCHLQQTSIMSWYFAFFSVYVSCHPEKGQPKTMACPEPQMALHAEFCPQVFPINWIMSAGKQEEARPAKPSVAYDAR